ncbi:sialic acid-binding lectin-like [Spea bombifrons]|uniref:sialic acid-binding lectin-like n=1 Tax=Spea bombifrons TaxID=233779 RepID=UPI0023496838|nr:sialic acid-binding lectin-like [Spea bombifrons]
MSSVLPVLLTLGVLLSVSSLGESQNFEEFKKNHVVNDENINCTNIIRRRQIRHKNGTCKAVNTFIYTDSIENIKSICPKSPNRRTVLSQNKFNLIECRLQRPVRQTCHYRERHKYDKICVTCENSKPVHFVPPGTCRAAEIIPGSPEYEAQTPPAYGEEIFSWEPAEAQSLLRRRRIGRT